MFQLRHHHLTLSLHGQLPVTVVEISASVVNDVTVRQWSVHKKCSYTSIFIFVGVIQTQELLDHETTPHYWLTVYAMDRGVVPLSSFVEVYIEVQDVNDNAPQTSEPVYYPSVMENSPKDVSIIQLNAVDPDSKASDKLTYRITSGNPQGFFAINGRTGKIALRLMEFMSHVQFQKHVNWG